MVPRLLGHEVLARDANLLLFRVAGQLDDLHPVAERGRHGVEKIGRCDEERARQVKRHVHVVVAECGVLLGVEDLEKRRGRVAAEVHPQLVDLVEHEDRVLGLGAAQPVDDLARQRADIRPPVAANFGLVPHPPGEIR
jgi:hypothetical protein